LLSYLVNSSLLGDKNQSSSYDVLFGYSTCKFHKSKILPFIPLDNRSIKCFDIIHNDVWGITLIISHAHYKYFMRFIDDYNWFTYMYFLHSKFEVFFILKTFFFYIKTQFSICIMVLRSYLGRECMSHEFHNFLHQKGIVSE
jgi:hypothetical protein